MSDSMKQRYIYAQEADVAIRDLAGACAAQGNEYGYSYYWWYYGVHTSGCHALGRKS
jgi:hypothetical protein